MSGERMQFEKALKVWGAAKLSNDKVTVNPDTVTVMTDFNEGYACCGGSDPDCYCSYAESPSAHVVIMSGSRRYEIDLEDFDFATILGEIVQAGNGTLNL
jgi:hypothetical protein